MVASSSESRFHALNSQATLHLTEAWVRAGSTQTQRGSKDLQLNFLLIGVRPNRKALDG